jgi:signal transduction histidine kinase
MFNKEGIPFFIIIIPFLCLVFFAFFVASYYLKLSEETNKTIELTYERQDLRLEEKQEFIKNLTLIQKQKFIHYIWVITICILAFMLIFSLMMNNIVHDIIRKYKEQVHSREDSLKELNRTLALKVSRGIKEGKEKDKTILRESRLAILGSMLSMIAHQWRQPLSELSGILMELEMATKFKKITDEKLYKSIERSNKRIEYMSSTIDDFRNFYKPDKTKEWFSLAQSCEKAMSLIHASLKNAGIKLVVSLQEDVQYYGFSSEFAQAILNILSNAKDVLIERKIKAPTIILTLKIGQEVASISIKDNAGGIKEEDMDKIFDPYFSTKDASKGTGLGLYIVQMIIEKNPGAKLLFSNDFEGATFTILLQRQNDG